MDRPAGLESVMRVVELAKKTGRSLVMSAALLGALSLAAAPAAQARDWHGGGGHWHGGGGHWHHGGFGGGVGLGLLGGALAGAAIASSPYYYGYSYPYYGYGYAPYGYYGY